MSLCFCFTVNGSPVYEPEEEDEEDDPDETEVDLSLIMCCKVTRMAMTISSLSS